MSDDVIENPGVSRYSPRFRVNYTDTGESLGQMQAMAEGEWVKFEAYKDLESRLQEALARDRKGDEIIVDLTLERDRLAGRLASALNRLDLVDAVRVSELNINAWYAELGAILAGERDDAREGIYAPVVENSATVKFEVSGDGKKWAEASPTAPVVERQKLNDDGSYQEAVRHADRGWAYLKTAVAALYQIWRKDVVNPSEFAWATLLELPSAGAYEPHQAPRTDLCGAKHMGLSCELPMGHHGKHKAPVFE